MDDASFNEEMLLAYIQKQSNSTDNYHYQYDEWIGLKNKYIGLKIISNTSDYLGWVKIEVIDYSTIYIDSYYLKQVR